MTPTRPIETLIRQVTDLNKTPLVELSEAFVQKAYSSGSTLMRQGEANATEYLLLTGRARSLVLDAEGREVTLGLFDGPAVLPPNIARTTGETSLVTIELLDDAVVGMLPSPKLIEMMVCSAEIREWGNLVMQRELARKVEREWCLAALSARDRLAWFRRNYKGFESRFQHVLIASFLGMTPVTLSRVRNG